MKFGSKEPSSGLDIAPLVSPVSQRADVEQDAPGPVLVAVDLTSQSPAALLWACRYAEKTATRVIVLHVLYDPPEAPGKYSRHGDKNTAPMVDVATEMLADFMTAWQGKRSDLRSLALAQKLVVKGLPAGTIVEQAIKCKASLIVVACRAEGLLPRLMHGSTAEKLLRLSPIPVTVVKDRSTSFQCNETSKP